MGVRRELELLSAILGFELHLARDAEQLETGKIDLPQDVEDYEQKVKHLQIILQQIAEEYDGKISVSLRHAIFKSDIQLDLAIQVSRLEEHTLSRERTLNELIVLSDSTLEDELRSRGLTEEEIKIILSSLSRLSSTPGQT